MNSQAAFFIPDLGSSVSCSLLLTACPRFRDLSQYQIPTHRLVVWEVSLGLLAQTSACSESLYPLLQSSNLPGSLSCLVGRVFFLGGGLFSQEGLSTSPLSPHVPDPHMDLHPHTLTRHAHTRSLPSCRSFKRSLERGQWRELTTRAPLLTELDEFTKRIF